MKKHVGRPTNEEIKRRKIKKAIMIILPVAIIVFAVIAISNSDTLSKLMGNSVTEYYCEDPSYTLEGTNCTKLIKEKANLLGDVDLDGNITIKDVSKLRENIEFKNEIIGVNLAVSDVNLDGEANEEDIKLLQNYVTSSQTLSTVTLENNIGIKKVCANNYTLNGDYCEKQDVVKALVKNTTKNVENPVEVTITDDQNGNTEITTANKVNLTVNFKVNDNSKKYYYMLKTYLDDSDNDLSKSECLEIKEGNINQILDLKEGSNVKGIYTVYSNETCNVVVKRFETKSYKLTTPIKEDNNTFTIKYNSNKGNGTMSDQKIAYGKQTPLSKNKFTRAGYGFNGWYAYNETKKQWNCYKSEDKKTQGYTDDETCKKYGTVRYSDGMSVAYTGDPGETVTLYAQWTNQFTIKYNSNKGNGTMSDQKITYGKETVLSKNKFTRAGYVFNGWYAYNETKKQWNCYKSEDKKTQGYADAATCNKYGTVRYSNGVTVAYTGDPGETVTMYAQWKNPNSTNNNNNTNNTNKNKNNKKASDKKQDKTSQNKTTITKRYATISDVAISQTTDQSNWIFNINANKNDSKIVGYCVSGLNKGADCKNLQSTSNITIKAESSKVISSICYNKGGENIPVYVTVKSEMDGKVGYDTVTKKIHCNSEYEKSPVSSYVCPNGYTKVGDGPTAYCQKQTGYNYTCDTGWKKVGEGSTAYCQKAIDNKYICDSGWTKVGDGPTAYCQKQSGYKYTCNSGWTKVGEGSTAYCQKATGTSYTCPSGYTQIGGGSTSYCQKFTGYKYTCPSGWSKIGDGSSAYCRKVQSVSYTCSKGFTKVGDGPTAYCQKATGTSYTCPSGYTKAGDGPSATCFKGKGSSRKTAKIIKKTKYDKKNTTKTNNYAKKGVTSTKQYSKKSPTKKTIYAKASTNKTKNYLKKNITVKTSYSKKNAISTKVYKKQPVTVEYKCTNGYIAMGEGNLTYCIIPNNIKTKLENFFG